MWSPATGPRVPPAGVVFIHRSLPSLGDTHGAPPESMLKALLVHLRPWVVGVIYPAGFPSSLHVPARGTTHHTHIHWEPPRGRDGEVLEAQADPVLLWAPVRPCAFCGQQPAPDPSFLDARDYIRAAETSPDGKSLACRHHANGTNPTLGRSLVLLRLKLAGCPHERGKPKVWVSFIFVSFSYKNAF